jgi:hypothetical protein
MTSSVGARGRVGTRAAPRRAYGAEKDTAQPLVTIVMATYNRDRFLQEALESLLSQDYPNLEILVLDDGSSDGTPAVLERYAASNSKRMRHIRCEHVGEYETLNRGFAVARGELIGRFCDDDRMLPGAVTRLAEELVAHPEAVASYCGWHFMDERGEIVDTYIPIEYSAVDSIRLMDWIVGPWALFRRRVFDEVGGWDPEFPHCGDWEFCLRASRLGPFRLVAHPLFAIRQHPGRKGGQEGLGPEHARAYVELVDTAFSDEALARELGPFRAQAYRNAYVLAAWAAGPGMNGPDERFYIADRHWRGNLEREGNPRDLEAQVAELSAETRRIRDQMEDEIAERDRHIRAQDEHIRAVDAARDSLVAYMNRPRWWRVARELTPNRLRPWAKRLACRAGQARPDGSSEAGAPSARRPSAHQALESSPQRVRQ